MSAADTAKAARINKRLDAECDGAVARDDASEGGTPEPAARPGDARMSGDDRLPRATSAEGDERWQVDSAFEVGYRHGYANDLGADPFTFEASDAHNPMARVFVEGEGAGHDDRLDKRPFDLLAVWRRRG